VTRLSGLLAVMFVACTPGVSPYSQHHYQNQFPDQYHYVFRADQVTPSGIAVDTSGVAVDLAALDRQTDEVEACLAEAFGPVPRLPPALVADAHCDGAAFPLPLLRGDLAVKVAANWVPSCVSPTQQLLPVPGQDWICEAKGQTPTPECPCRLRAGIQDNEIIVVTPDQYLYKDPLIRLVTGCNNPWVGALAVCARPSVQP
jgi:hypothetical protein